MDTQEEHKQDLKKHNQPGAENQPAEDKILTTSMGCPVDNNQYSMTAGPRGPLLLQDFTLLDKLASFDR